MKATVTSKGQITIPHAIRRKLGLHPGTVLDFDAGADHLRARKSVDAARMRSVVGVGRSELKRKSLQEWLDELRGPVELPSVRRRRR
jgi:AbrB family looped-hinge helix DNA binding protein